MSKIKLSADIKKLIEEQLPGMHAGVMREFIEKAEAGEEHRQELLKEVANQKLEIERYKKRDLWDHELRDRAKKLDDRERDLDLKRQTIEEENRNIAIMRLQLELEAERRCTRMAQDLNLSLTRNLEYRSSVHRDSSRYDGQGRSTSTTDSHTTEKTVE